MTLDTRQHIIKTAITLFLENGLPNVSFNAVVRATELSKGGVYHYFASKDELILAIYDYFLKDFFINEQDIDNSKSAWQSLQHWFLHSIDITSGLSNYRRLFIDLFFYATSSEVGKQKNIESYNRFYNFIVKKLEQAKQEGDVKCNINSQLSANALIGIADGIDAAACILGDKQLNSKQATAYGITLLLNSLATEQGLKNSIISTQIS